MNKKIIVILLAGLVLAGCSSQDDIGSQTQGQTEEIGNVENTEGSDNASGAAASPSAVKVDLIEAVDTFKDEFPDSEITEIDILNKDNAWVYDITGQDSANEYEMTLDAVTGEKIYSNTEADEDLDDDQAINIDQVISTKDAEAIARANGVTYILRMSLENEDGKDYWTAEDKDTDLEVVIDAVTGEVVEKDS